MTLNNYLFFIGGSNELNMKFQLNGGLSLPNSSGLTIKLADTSLSLSSLGLQVSTTYKSELQQIKTTTIFQKQAQIIYIESEELQEQARKERL